jgi:hypothetical protein
MWWLPPQTTLQSHPRQPQWPAYYMEGKHGSHSNCRSRLPMQLASYFHVIQNLSSTPHPPTHTARARIAACTQPVKLWGRCGLGSAGKITTRFGPFVGDPPNRQPNNQLRHPRRRFNIPAGAHSAREHIEVHTVCL